MPSNKNKTQISSSLHFNSFRSLLFRYLFPFLSSFPYECFLNFSFASYHISHHLFCSIAILLTHSCHCMFFFFFFCIETFWIPVASNHSPSKPLCWVQWCLLTFFQFLFSIIFLNMPQVLFFIKVRLLCEIWNCNISSRLNGLLGSIRNRNLSFSFFICSLED